MGVASKSDFVSGCLLALLCAATPAAAQPPAPGTYESEGGWGTLVIQLDKGGKRTFAIESMGANAHSCTVDGTVEGTAAIPADQGAEKCRIDLLQDGAKVEVKISTPEACRYYCGMRASFDGVYERPQAACTAQARKARRDRFLVDYRARRYAQALPALQALVRDCGRFLTWFEQDEVRNDLAITQYHLGRKDECLATLADTLALKQKDEAGLREALPPSDFDNYLGIAKAAWTNRRLCGGRT